ncbi:MAG: insulinase family protein, partial [Flavobacteriales bacterium]|nr:insulinase family protein [Flavobacteriales bacterium]
MKTPDSHLLLNGIFAHLFMEFYTFTLDNGIRVIHKQISRDVSHCGLIVNAGSRDELEHQQGLAHFIEHCVFKGTKKRKPFHILSRLDSVGAEINAYTTKEETCIYGSFLEQHLERAMELMSDITFNSTFPEKELLKEKEVILDEILSYQDSPGEQIFDDFEDFVYSGHPIGRNILGTEESLKELNREEILEFIGRRYRNDQLVFTSVGNTDPRKVRRLCEKHLGDRVGVKSEDQRLPFAGYSPKHLEVEKDTHQVHYILGAASYAHNDEKRTTMVLLNNILGGPGLNSRLNLHIREKYGFAYNIESMYHSYSDTGLFQLYLATDPKYIKKTLKLVRK